MNESGPKLVKQFQRWLETQDKLFAGGTGTGKGTGLGLASSLQNTTTAAMLPPATLVILHDELEAPLGRIRVKRGGPEAASLRGHRGLISTFQTLRGKGLYTGDAGKGIQRTGSRLGRDISVLRVGVGIGRPVTREKGAVAEYVLSEMGPAEVAAVERAAGSVMGLLEEEFDWEGGTLDAPGSKV